MKIVLVPGLIVLALTVSRGIAAAQPASSPNSHVGIAGKVSSLGYGFDAAVPVAERANVRAGFNFFTFSNDFDSDGITLDATLKLRSVSAHLDWFPLGGAFHISPGVMLYNGNEVDAIASVPPSKRFTLGDSDLLSNPANPVKGTAAVTFPRVAPSLLLGWGNLIPRGQRRWSIPVELGVVYSRAPTAVLDLTGSACNPNGSNCRNLTTDPGLRGEVTKQQNEINDDISVLKVLPVISVGFSYKF